MAMDKNRLHIAKDLYSVHKVSKEVVIASNTAYALQKTSYVCSKFSSYLVTKLGANKTTSFRPTRDSALWSNYKVTRNDEISQTNCPPKHQSFFVTHSR
jgi:hypothetical protein